MRFLNCHTSTSSLQKGTNMRKCLLFSLACALLFLLSACKSQEPAKPAEEVAQYRPTSTIKDIMDSMVDPSADYMWDSVATIISDKGIEERQPRTPKEWAEIRRKAITDRKSVV